MSGILPPRRDEAAALATLVLSTLLDPDPRTPDFDDSVLSAARRALPWIRRAGLDRTDEQPTPRPKAKRPKPDPPELVAAKADVTERSALTAPDQADTAGGCRHD